MPVNPQSFKMFKQTNIQYNKRYRNKSVRKKELRLPGRRPRLYVVGMKSYSPVYTGFRSSHNVRNKHTLIKLF